MSKKKNKNKAESQPESQEGRGKFGLPFGLGKSKADAGESGLAPAAPLKPSEALSSVLDECVPASALDFIRANAPFTYPAGARSNCTCYVVLKIDVRDIGGLNKHMKHDPDKGQFIEYVNRGSVQIYASEDDLAASVFYIIPTSESLTSLMEFEFLADSSRFAKYQITLVHVDSNADMDFEPLDNAFVDLKWARDIAAGRVTVSDAIRDIQIAAVTGSEPENDQAVDGENTGEAAPEDKSEPGAGSDDNEFNNSFISQFAQPAQEVQPAQQVQTQQGQEAAYPDSEFAPLPEDVQAGFEPEPEVYTQEQQPAQAQPDEFIDSGMGGMVCPRCGNPVYPGAASCSFCNLDLTQPYDASYDDDYQDDDGEITDEEVQAACERLFHAGGLDLEITAQPFDIQFMQKNPFVPISEDRGDGWLDGYVTQMVKNANSELRRMHAQNLFNARNRYLALMTEACEKIATEVDMSSPDTPYYAVQKKLADQASARRASIEKEVSRRRTDMQRTWDEELQQVMDSAAAAARRTYVDKHSADHEAKLRDVEISLLDSIEIDYQRDLAGLNDKRRTEAKKKLDLYTSQTLQTMGENYASMVEEEDKARAEFLQAIQDYIDTNRKDEVARMEVQAEAQRQKEAADKTAEEYERRLKAIAADHAATCDKYVQEIQAARTHEESMKADYNTRAQEARNREEKLQSQYDALMNRYESLDAMKSKEYEARITTLENDKKAAEEHLAHVDAVHNKFNKVSIVIWGAVTAAALCIGLLLGAKLFGKPVISGGGDYQISFRLPKEAESAAPVESNLISAAPEDGGENVSQGPSEGQEPQESRFTLSPPISPKD